MLQGGRARGFRRRVPGGCGAAPGPGSRGGRAARARRLRPFRSAACAKPLVGTRAARSRIGVPPMAGPSAAWGAAHEAGRVWVWGFARMAWLSCVRHPVGPRPARDAAARPAADRTPPRPRPAARRSCGSGACAGHGPSESPPAAGALRSGPWPDIDGDRPAAPPGTRGAACPRAVRSCPPPAWRRGRGDGGCAGRGLAARQATQRRRGHPAAAGAARSRERRGASGCTPPYGGARQRRYPFFSKSKASSLGYMLARRVPEAARARLAVRSAAASRRRRGAPWRRALCTITPSR